MKTPLRLFLALVASFAACNFDSTIMAADGPVAVSSYTELATAIASYNSSTADMTISITGTITLTGELPTIKGLDGTTLTITGGTINGAGVCRGLVVDTAKEDRTEDCKLVVNGTTFKSCVATGGNGGSGANGAGGGLGAGGAIYARTGAVELVDVQFEGNKAQGGNGGHVLQGSTANGAGGGLGGDGASGTAGDETTYPDGRGGNGGGMTADSDGAMANVVAGSGGGESYDPYTDASGKEWNQSAHTEGGLTGLVGGDGNYGGGGAGSTYIGGDGGLGGGGGAGATAGGVGGFGAGGGGSTSVTTSGLGGFAAGDGGYQETITSTKFANLEGGGVGGGGAALGGAVYIEENASVTVSYTKDTTLSGNTVQGGNAGVIDGTTFSGSALAGDGVGQAFFLKDDLTVNVDENATVTMNDTLGGYAGSEKNALDINKGGLIKEGEGTLLVNGLSTYTGNTVVRAGTLGATGTGALSQYSSLVVDGGIVRIDTDQTVVNLFSSTNDNVFGVVNLYSKKLTISEGGDGSDIYYGQILSDGYEKGTGGVLIKNGDGILALAGDSRGRAIIDPATGEPKTDFVNNFTTWVNNGSLWLGNDGALGDGILCYGRTDVNDATHALLFGERVEKIDNEIMLYGNATAMRIGTASDNTDANYSVELAGRISTKESGSPAMIVQMADANQTVLFSNTGINDEGSWSQSRSNAFNELQIKKGTVNIVTEKIAGATPEADQWYTGLGNTSLVNLADGNTLVISGEEAEETLFLHNTIHFNDGLLRITNAIEGQDIALTGIIEGAGGMNVDLLDADDRLSLVRATATYTGKTLLTNGILDISQASGKAVHLGGLMTNEQTQSAVLVVGSKTLAVSSDENLTFIGKITDSLDTPSAENPVTIAKAGTGTWNLGLAEGSNVASVTVNKGFLSDADGSLQDTVIYLCAEGGFTTNGDETSRYRVLDKLNASTAGSKLQVLADDILVLSDQNASTKIASSLYGAGILQLDKAATDWSLTGDNSNWTGTISVADETHLIADNVNAFNANTTVALNKNAVLDAKKSTTLGTLKLYDDAELSAGQGATLSLNKIEEVDATNVALKVTGQGVVALNQNAAAQYHGTTFVEDGTLKINGDNTLPPDAGTRGETILKNGTLWLNYSGMTPVDGAAFNSIWGDETLRIVGAGAELKVTGGPQDVSLDTPLAFEADTTDPENPVGAALNVNTNLHDLMLTGEITGTGAMSKTGLGKLILANTYAALTPIDAPLPAGGSEPLDGPGVPDFTPANITSFTAKEGTTQLGDGETSSTLFANTDVTILQNATVTGMADSLGSVVLLGTLNMTNRSPITLTADEGENAFVMGPDSKLNLYMQDAENYTQYETTNGRIQIAGGTMNLTVDDDYKIRIKLGDSLDVLKTENGTLSADLNNLLLTDNVEGKSLVASMKDGILTLVFKKVDFTETAVDETGTSVGEYLNDASEEFQGDPDKTDTFNLLENSMAVNPNMQRELSGEVYMSAVNVQVNTHITLREVIREESMPSGEQQYTGCLRGQMAPRTGLATWGTMLGATGDVSPDNSAAGYDYGMLGLVAGVAVGSSETMQAGAYYSYMNSDIKTGSNMGHVDMDQNIFGGFFRWNDPFGYGLVLANGGLTGYEGGRGVQLYKSYGAFDGEQNGKTANVYLERGARFMLGKAMLQPYLGLSYTWIQQDGIDEQGNIADLRLRSDDLNYDSFQGVLGVRLARDFCLAGRSSRGFLYANYAHEFLDTAAEGEFTMAGFGQEVAPFRVVGADLGSEWFFAGLGGQIQLSDRWELFGSVDTQLNSCATFVSGNGGARFRW